MNLSGKSIVITGAGGGIGEALAHRFAREDPRGILVADIDPEAADRVARAVDGVSFEVDVSHEPGDVAMIDTARSHFGPIDLLCLNAGVAVAGGVEGADALWERAWAVNVMSHVYGVRAVLPEMVARGSGYILHTASAAGLLTSVGAAPYSVTKHAVVALAEWLSITYGGRGVKVSCLSPQFVRTAMINPLDEISPGFARFAHSISLGAEEVAEVVVAGIRSEVFHILPHTEVGTYIKNRANDPERWLAEMRALQASFGVPKTGLSSGTPDQARSEGTPEAPR